LLQGFTEDRFLSVIASEAKQSPDSETGTSPARLA